jgi:hypothetical protein
MGIRGYQVFSLSIASGAAQTFRVAGTFIYARTLSGDLTVHIDGTRMGAMSSASDYRLPDGDEFTEVKFQNESGGTITGTVIIGYGAWRDYTLSIQDLLGSAIAHSAVAPTTSATLVIAANANRKAVTVKNAGTVDCYIGGSGVTTALGSPLLAGESFRTERSTAALYAITASGTADLRVLEES